MAYELLIGLNVTNEVGYQQYRETMRPILEAHGGGFRYDFRVSETLQSDADHEINRVFALFFEDENARERFFANEAYQEIRKQHFIPSVDGSTVIAAYDVG